MAASERDAAGALAQATDREMKSAKSFKSDRTATQYRTVAWAVIGVALFVVLGADGPKPDGFASAAAWSDSATRQAR